MVTAVQPCDRHHLYDYYCGENRPSRARGLGEETYLTA